eukprot:2532214-Rhodomonas_salina.3
MHVASDPQNGRNPGRPYPMSVPDFAQQARRLTTIRYVSTGLRAYDEDLEQPHMLGQYRTSRSRRLDR